MRRRIAIVLWIMGLLACAPAGGRSAAEEAGGQPAPETETKPSGEGTKLETVVVTATRRETLLSDVPDVVQVIPRRDIDEINPTETGRLFEYVPGASVETGTGSGFTKRSIVGLNGLPANYTLVLIDGVRLLSEHIHTGQNLEMIPAQSIERIEIIRGAASAQYGTDAIGGVVNVITRKCGDAPATSVGGSSGSYRTYEGDVGILQPLGKNVRMSLFLNREQSDGVRLLLPAHRVGNMGYERTNLMARVDVDPDEVTRLFAWGNFADNTMAWRGADSDSYLDMGAIGGSRQLTPSLTLSAQVSRSIWEAEASGERNQVIQPETMLTWEISRAHTVSGGVDFRHNRFARTGLDHAMDQETWGGFVQDEWRMTDQFTLMLALRYDHVEQVGGALAPKLSALYSPELPLRVRASISRGFHAPTLQELYEEAYGHGGTALRFGNPDLDPEYSMTYTLGVELFPQRPLEVVLYGHYSRIDDMIVPVYEGPWSVDPTKDVWMRTNIEEATVYGGEIMVRYTFSPRLRIEAGYCYTGNENEETGRQLPYFPGSALFAKAVVDRGIGADWKLSGFVGLRCVFDRSAWNWQPAPTAPPDDPDGLTTPLEDYQNLEAGLSASYKDLLSVFVNVDNILGQDFENLDDAFTKIDGAPVFKVGFRLKW